MFSSESLELLNQDYASSTDSDYELPDHVQKKSLHETCELTRSTANQLEKEEKMRRIFETKINRYPLRHCVKVGTSDLQNRPNYYESDQEEEEKEKQRPMRRRHSIAASLTLDQEEEEENGEANNLCRNIRKRRYSEGLDSVLEEENSGGKSADIQGSVCITRTVTYKSKKQIIKFYQTKNLILNPSESEFVSKRLSGNNANPENQQKLTNIVDKICRGTIPKNKQLKEIEGVRGRRKLLECQKGTPKESSLVKNGKRAIQNEMDLQRQNVDAKECTVKNNNNQKSYFLGQLGLHTQCNSKGKTGKKKAGYENTALTCTMKISNKKDEVTQSNSENSASSLEKYMKNEGGKTFSKVRGKKKPGENTRVRVDSKTEEEKALNDKPNVEINSQLKNDGKINNSIKNSLRKKNKEKYLAIVKKDCENLFQPDLLLRKDSLEKTVTKESRDNTKQTTCESESPEKRLKTEEGPYKKKVTWHKETGKINVPGIVMPKGNQKIYNIKELECKLKSLFEEPLNKSLLEKTAGKIEEKTTGCDLNTKDEKKIHFEENTDPHTNNGKDKPPQYCVLHRKKANSEKRAKRELERVEQSKKKLHLQKSTDKTQQNLPVFADVEIEKKKKKIAVLREKQRMLCKIKSALEKTWCTKVCSKNSCLKLKRYRRKTKVERESVAGRSKPNVVEEGEHSLVRQSNAELQNDNREISDSNSKNVKMSVGDTEQSKLKEEETIEEKFEDLHVASEKNASGSLEIVQVCICCSPRTRMAESSNDFPTENNDLRSKHSPKVPEESETLDVISLSENSVEGMDSKNLTAYIDSGVCCVPRPWSEKKYSTDQEKLETKEIVIIDLTDDFTSISDENNAETKICSPPEDNATKAGASDRISNLKEVINVVDSPRTTTNAEQVSDATVTEENSARTQISQETTFLEESQDLIIGLSDISDTSPLGPKTSQTENECINKGSTTANLTTDDVQLSMTMEHYKKRLIHQHEKPGTAPSPCTTTEEEDDSLESPLSPASSVQSRDSVSMGKRKEEVVQKVARKRAVCRSQFRHQNMELFKLGSSIPTSLCKTKEPYNVCAEKNLQLCYQNGTSKKFDKNSAKGSLTESILNTIDGGKKRDVPLWRSISLTNETENQNLNSNSGRHILPAIVPELPEHRRSRIKSLPENTSKNVTDNAKAQRSNNGLGNVYDFVEEKEETNTHKSQHAIDKEDNMATTHRNKNITSRRQSTSSTQTPQVIKAQSVDTSTTQQSTMTNTKTQSQNVTEVPYIGKESSTEVQEVMEACGRNANVTSIMPRQFPSSEIQGIVPAHSQNAVRRSISAEYDANDCVPINLSLRTKEEANSRHSWPGLVNADYRKRSEVNKNQHPSNPIPRQPSNVPKKPQQDVAKVLNENIASAIASEGAHVDKDGNCFFVTSIPGSALDPHKQSNVIVINFPHIQQQMARMEKPPGVEKSLDMLDSAIMSLVNIVKSSVESVFNVMSLPVLNRLYIDLNRYLVLPAVSVKMKMCIEEALNSLIIYLLANLLRTPCTSKARDFVHKLLLLDLRPHMDFLINSLGLIQQKIKYDYFMDELLKILSHSPQENHFPAPRQHFSMQQLPLDYRDYRRNNLWIENYGYEAPSPYELMPGISPQKRGRRPTQEGQNSVSMDTRVPENFSAPNLTLMRPDSYLADNRCIPPNNPPVHPEQFYMHSSSQPRPKGRPRNSSKINKTTASKHGDPLSVLPVHDQILHRRLTTENPTAVTSRNHDPRRSSIDSINPEMNRRSSEFTLHRETIEEVTHTRPLEAALIENTGNVFDHNVRQEMNHKQQNGGIVPIWAPPSDTTMDLSIRSGVPSFKNAEAPLKSHSGGKAVIVGNEVVQRREQKEDSNPRNLVPVNGQIGTTSQRENVLKQFPVPDVEQYLQTNIIVNKNQRNPVNLTSVIVKDDKKISEKLVGSEKIKEAAQLSERREASEASKKDGISSTVIIEDKSMVVSKGGACSLQNRAQSNPMDLDDVVLERVSSNVNSKCGISCTARRVESHKTNEKAEGEADVSIEKVNDAPPKLIKLTSLKRRLTLDEKWQKKPKVGAGMFNSNEVVVIDDDEEPAKLDCNQNDVTKPSEDTETIKKKVDDEKSAIEDISSEEEALESFRLYSTYENKLASDPGKILRTTEVSHCTLIPGNVKAVQNANWHLFEKTPVYTRPVLPRKLRKLSLDVDLAPKREPLANLVRFEEDHDSFACSLNLSNSDKYPTSMDVMGFAPPESRSRTPSFKSPPGLIPVVHTSPNLPRVPVVQTSPQASGPTLVQTSPVSMSNSPFAMGPPVTPTPPRASCLPVVQTSPVPFVMGPPVVPTSPRVGDQPVVQTSPVPVPNLPGVQISPLNESGVNWGHWFSEEQRNGVFDFDRARRQSTETPSSEYSPGFEPFCEIKVDSKTCRIKRSLLERIPKGKLCYVRESNTFVRYFDNSQMELFISNLNLGEGSTAAQDLLKQVRGRADAPADVETPPGQGEPSPQGEVIALAKDVVFSTEDFLSDPELYVEEVEKVQRYAPKDFYGFYKFVTGYQIVNHHPPISFQTFLTMHNTNGIRGLFKNYVNTLVEGRNVL